MPEHIKKQLLEEISILEHELSHELPAEIKKAVAMGDLSENAEYHMAKQRQDFVNARLGQLKRRMAELSLVNLSNIPQGQGGIRIDGGGIRLHQGRRDCLPAGDERGVGRLQGADFDDVADWARDWWASKVGDMATIVTPNGKRELEILKLTTIHDEAEKLKPAKPRENGTRPRQEQ